MMHYYSTHDRSKEHSVLCKRPAFFDKQGIQGVKTRKKGVIMKLSNEYEIIKEQLEQIKDDINRIKYEARTSEENTQHTLVQILSKINARQAQLELKLEELQSSDHKSWDELVNVYEGVQHDMEEAIAHVGH